MRLKVEKKEVVGHVNWIECHIATLMNEYVYWDNIKKITMGGLG